MTGYRIEIIKVDDLDRMCLMWGTGMVATFYDDELAIKVQGLLNEPPLSMNSFCHLVLHACAGLSLGFKIVYAHGCIWADRIWSFLP